MRRNPKLTPQKAVEDLREQGYQPLFREGRLVEWRRVHEQNLLTAKVIVHTSGRASITYRSTVDAKKAGRKRNRREDHAA